MHKEIAVCEKINRNRGCTDIGLLCTKCPLQYGEFNCDYFGNYKPFGALKAAKAFLKKHKPEVTTTKNSKVIDNPSVETKTIKFGNVDVTVEYSEPEKVVYQSHKDYLEALIKKMDANKEIFIETHDNKMNNIYSELVCNYNGETIAYVDADGKYKIEGKLNSDKMIAVTKWVNRLEKNMESVKVAPNE